ncbi:unnamed protein product [Rhizophagus irregularis]|nr:unnamed protein product [Rhizophagus irregularis]
MYWNECQNQGNKKQTEIIESSDIGPVTTNNPGAIYKSRPLSDMIQSAMSTRSLRIQQLITTKSGQFDCHQGDISFNDKRKFEDNTIENCFNEDKIIKKIRLIENENNGKYFYTLLSILK